MEKKKAELVRNIQPRVRGPAQRVGYVHFIGGATEGT